MTKPTSPFWLFPFVAIALTPLQLAMQQSGDRTFLLRLEREIVAEHNRARSDPSGYAAHLGELKRYFDGKLLKRPGEIAVITDEGVLAVNEAIRVLERTQPVERVKVSRGLSRAARDHVNDQGPRGRLGHSGSDGSEPWDRAGRYGDWRQVVAENITYGTDTGRKVVLQLIIDDGVRDRGHRDNVFNPVYRVIGVACGEHAKFRIMCTIVYAGGFDENQ